MIIVYCAKDVNDLQYIDVDKLKCSPFGFQRVFSAKLGGDVFFVAFCGGVPQNALKEALEANQNIDSALDKFAETTVQKISFVWNDVPLENITVYIHFGRQSTRTIDICNSRLREKASHGITKFCAVSKGNRYPDKLFPKKDGEPTKFHPPKDVQSCNSITAELRKTAKERSLEHLYALTILLQSITELKRDKTRGESAEDYVKYLRKYVFGLKEGSEKVDYEAVFSADEREKIEKNSLLHEFCKNLADGSPIQSSDGFADIINSIRNIFEEVILYVRKK